MENVLLFMCLFLDTFILCCINRDRCTYYIWALISFFFSYAYPVTLKASMQGILYIVILKAVLQTKVTIC